MTRLTVFYDGQCPLCVKEMRQLYRYDKQSQQLRFEDLNQADISERYSALDRQKALDILHVQNAQGEWLLGVDANIALWQAVKRKRWLRVLRWPLLAPIADWAYLRFANNRYTLSRLVTGQSRCTSCRIDQ